MPSRLSPAVESVHRGWVCAVDGVVLMWFGGLGMRGVVDGVTVAMSVMAAALPVIFCVDSGKAAW